MESTANACSLKKTALVIAIIANTRFIGIFRNGRSEYFDRIVCKRLLSGGCRDSAVCGNYSQSSDVSCRGIQLRAAVGTSVRVVMPNERRVGRNRRGRYQVFGVLSKRDPDGRLRVRKSDVGTLGLTGVQMQRLP